MFCQKCGNELENSARFCDKCGASQVAGAQEVNNAKMPDNEVIFTIKPTFKLFYYLCGILVSVILIFVVFVIMAGYAEIEEMIIGGWIVSGIILILGLIYVVFKAVQIKNMEYKFYRTKVEYTDSFLNKTQKEVKYKYIRETLLSRRIFDRIFGFGTIILFTNAETSFGNGIFIPCIVNSEEQYKKIKELLDI